MTELPTFDRPPVIEVVIGIQFDPLGKLLASHVGKFWVAVETEYPLCNDNPPIVPQIEDFERPGVVKGTRLSLISKPDIPRVFLEDETGQWLIQIQRDRFLHNWRGVPDESEYPRYPEVRRRFFAQWENFEKFIRHNEVGKIRITQLEITYLNHIPVPSSKLGEVFPDFKWRQDKRALSLPESIEASYSFKSTGEPKRLRVSLKPTVQKEQQGMRLELTVRGQLQDDESLETWLDHGRAWIVTAFADLTSEEWHSKWGRVR